MRVEIGKRGMDAVNMDRISCNSSSPSVGSKDVGVTFRAFRVTFSAAAFESRRGNVPVEGRHFLNSLGGESSVDLVTTGGWHNRLYNQSSRIL